MKEVARAASPGRAPFPGFLRARNLLAFTVAVVVVCLLVRVLGRWLLRLPGADATGAPTTMPLALVFPLVLACLVVSAMHSPYESLERLACRPLRLLRLVHASSVVVVVSVLLWLAASNLTGPLAALASVRNFVLLAGLGLLAVPLVGPRLAWVPPVGFSAWLLTAGASWASNPLVAANGSRVAGMVAAVALVLGVPVAALFTSVPLSSRAFPTNRREA